MGRRSGYLGVFLERLDDLERCVVDVGGDEGVLAFEQGVEFGEVFKLLDEARLEEFAVGVGGLDVEDGDFLDVLRETGRVPGFSVFR